LFLHAAIHTNSSAAKNNFILLGLNKNIRKRS
jgi:hypothetical protein